MTSGQSHYELAEWYADRAERCLHARDSFYMGSPEHVEATAACQLTGILAQAHATLALVAATKRPTWSGPSPRHSQQVTPDEAGRILGDPS